MGGSLLSPRPPPQRDGDPATPSPALRQNSPAAASHSATNMPLSIATPIAPIGSRAVAGAVATARPSSACTPAVASIARAIPAASNRAVKAQAAAATTTP